MGRYLLSESIPQWVSHVGSFSSIIGLVVTGFLFWEARKIRNSFLRRARLPEVIKELVEANKKLSKHLKNWDEEVREGVHQLLIAKELIDSLKPKLPDSERKKCSAYVQKLQTRTFFIFKSEISVVSTEKAWELYSGLSGLITMLEQLQKDSKWD
jgi:hypothetical protein